jgi:hypothetical protein
MTAHAHVLCARCIGLRLTEPSTEAASSGVAHYDALQDKILLVVCYSAEVSRYDSELRSLLGSLYLNIYLPRRVIATLFNLIAHINVIYLPIVSASFHRMHPLC